MSVGDNWIQNYYSTQNENHYGCFTNKLNIFYLKVLIRNLKIVKILFLSIL